MKQSYKIYINDIVIYLAEFKLPFGIQKSPQFAVFPCNTKKELQKIITAVEIQTIRHDIVIVGKNLKKLKDDFFSSFKIITAGGGIVVNEQGSYLLIYRNKKWDLPKGKIEKNEEIEEGSIREVEEETGVQVLNVSAKVGKTYHSYRLKDNWVLKETHWYLMQGDGQSNLVAQTEEDIEKVAWFEKKKALKKIRKEGYRSIYDAFKLATTV